jgi:hypothetical protein
MFKLEVCSNNHCPENDVKESIRDAGSSITCQEQQTVRQLQKKILTISPDPSEFDYPVMQLHGCENMKSLNKVFVSCDMFMRAQGDIPTTFFKC